MSKAGQKIIGGLNDALAFAQGDASRATVVWPRAIPNWKNIESAPLGRMVLLWNPIWRHPFFGQRNGDHGQVYVDTCEPEARGWQSFATHWCEIELPII